MICDELFNKACEEKINGNLERAYELFSEIVFYYPGTEYAIFANEEMTALSAMNSEYLDVMYEQSIA
ncbi:hypothetical protein SDC9_83261 [bioreactor metagenome]|uniref:Outer membrane protein assembly factor BamD n=1 Tax=bioreactor metagenome TaxID=1076179 RepID=A0A644Z778_9ZZZZ|nr:hypothetical protein [Candidatus Metalachnospira sp.]